MSKRMFTTMGITWSATALNAQATSGQYMALKANGAAVIADILDIKIDGAATASAVFGGLLNRASSIETGGASALASPNADGLVDPLGMAVATPIVTFIAAVTNQPIPSNATGDARESFTLNALGGQTRVNFPPGQAYSIFGTSTPFQECLLFNCSNANGTSAQVNASITYEPH